MQLLSNRSFSLLERITGLSSLLFLISIALYTDIFISVAFNESIFLVKDNWHLSRVSIGDWISYLIGISFLYAAVAPFIVQLANPLLRKNENKNKSFREDELRKLPLSEIREFAVTENNSPAYQYYQEQTAKLEQFKSTRKHAVVITFLTIVSVVVYHYGVLGDQSIFLSFINRLSEEGLLIGLLRLFVGGLGVYILAQVWMTDTFYEIHYLSPSKQSFEKRKEREWLTELTIGLVDMEVMNGHLKETINAISEFYPNIESAKASIKYCLRHGLVVIHNDGYELTAKGRYFSKYL